MASHLRTGGEIIVQALERAGVRHGFGVPGESFLGILDALHDSSIDFVSTRHEGGASFMASGYAKISGEIGVCFGTRAVGAANLAIGVHNARQDSTPMIAFAGDVNRAFVGREAFQEVDLVAAMAPFAKWAVRIPSADLAAETMARAVHAAVSGRPGPVFVSVPQDVCDEPGETGAIGPAGAAVAHPDPGAVAAVLDALLGARRPLVFSGGGLARSEGGRDRLVAFAEAAEIPVITGWRRYDGFPNDHRLFLGSAGLGAVPSVWERLAEADVILVLGNRMQENATAGYEYPLPEARLFQVDVEPAVMVNHRAPELAVTADASAMLGALLHQLSRPVPGAAGRRERNAADRARFETATTLLEGPVSDEGLSYPEVFRTLDRVLGQDTIVASDAGNFAGWLARYRRFCRPNTYLGPASGAMGYGLPAAIGAKIAAPGAPVVAISGDGGFLMTMAEIETAVRRQAPVVAVVLDNARHGTIRMHQERQHPGRVIGTELGSTDLSSVARGLGAVGHVVEDVAELDQVLRDALRSASPVVIQVRMDREQLSVDRRL